MPVLQNEQITARESVEHEWYEEEQRRMREHVVTLKQLELQIKREDNQAKIELRKLEAKWSSLLRLPSLLIRLPILFILSIAYIFAVLRKQEPSKDFWAYLK